MTRSVTLTDRFLIDANAIRITGDGYVTATPRVARTGVQLYRGSEVGVKDKAVVRVYRPADEVFHKDAMASLTHKPLTNEHPPVPVTAQNWKQYAVGQVGDEAIRDGEAVRVPMVLMDQEIIAQMKDGKRQLSVGYTCDVVDEAGVSPEGEAYDMVQRNIRGNHIAIVKDARGGPRLAIGDAQAAQFIKDVEAGEDDEDEDDDLLVNKAKAKEKIADGKVFDGTYSEPDMMLADGYGIGKNGRVSLPLLRDTAERARKNRKHRIADAAEDLLSFIDDHHKERLPMSKTILIDGVSVTFDTEQSAQIAERSIQSRDAKIKEITDAAASEVKVLKDQAATDAATIATLTKDKDTLSGENAALKKQVEDAKITPQKLDELVRDRDVLLGKAKAVMGDKLVVDGKTDAEIRKQVVDARLGDAAKGFNDDQISAAFTAFTADVKPASGAAAPALSDARSQFAQPAQTIADKNAFYDKRDKALEQRWKGADAAKH